MESSGMAHQTAESYSLVNSDFKATPMRLLDAAGPIFAEKGLREATVREICDQAGVNVAAIHYHFGDMEQLYVATVRRARGLREARHPIPKWDPSQSAEVRLHVFIKTILQRMLDPHAPWQVRLLMREILQPTEACRALVEDYFRPEFEQLLSIVKELLPERTTALECRRVAFSVMGQCVVYRLADSVIREILPPGEYQSDFQITDLARHIATFSLTACGNWPPATGNDSPESSKQLSDTS